MTELSREEEAVAEYQNHIERSLRTSEYLIFKAGFKAGAKSERAVSNRLRATIAAIHTRLTLDAKITDATVSALVNSCEEAAPTLKQLVESMRKEKPE